MKVGYLATPIDQTGSHIEELQDMRASARSGLAKAGYWVFDPSLAWRPSKQQAGEAVQQVNDAAISAADVMLALLPSGIPTVGVPIEIVRAARCGIPVALVAPRMPTALIGHAGVAQFMTVEAAIGWIRSDLPPRWNTRLQVSKLHDNAMLPTRAYEGDAGWDLYVDEDTTVSPGVVTDVPCGISVAIPHGHYGRIVGRSSTHRKRGLSVVEGIIDAGYRGPLFSGVWNPGSTPVHLARGERVCQLILTKVPLEHYIEVDVLPSSHRGENGFGSSG